MTGIFHDGRRHLHEGPAFAARGAGVAGPGGDRQAARAARQRLLGQRLRDRHRRPQGQRPGGDHRHAHVRQGTRAEHHPAGRRRRAQDHHGGVPDARTARTSTRRASPRHRRASTSPRRSRTSSSRPRSRTSPGRSRPSWRRARRESARRGAGATAGGRRRRPRGGRTARPTPPSPCRIASPAGASSGRSSRCSPTSAPAWSPRAASRRSSTTSCSPCRRAATADGGRGAGHGRRPRAVLRAMLYAQGLPQGFADDVLEEAAAVTGRAARPDHGRHDLTGAADLHDRSGHGPRLRRRHQRGP